MNTHATVAAVALKSQVKGVFVRELRRCLARLGLFAAVVLGSSTALAQAPAPAKARASAATAYDRGVQAFDRAEYASAARSFLEADALVPNEDALANALTAAERAKQRALTNEAAERVLSRPGASPELVARARAALANEQAAASETRAASTETATVPGIETPASEPALAEKNAAEGSDVPAEATQSGDETHSRDKPLPPAVFFAGAGATALLTGLTIWSGIDTLNARADLPGTQEDNDSVMARAHRTDALLIGTLVVGAATAYVGLTWVNWSDPKKSVAVRAHFDPAGGAVSVAGRF